MIITYSVSHAYLKKVLLFLEASHSLVQLVTKSVSLCLEQRSIFWTKLYLFRSLQECVHHLSLCLTLLQQILK